METEKHILIVEDNEESQVFLSTIVEEQGYGFRVAADGKAAMAAMEDRRPDLVLLDIMMPKKSGLNVLRDMKKNPELQTIPVIVITGSSEVTGVSMKSGDEKPLESEGDVVGQVFGNAIREKLEGLTPDDVLEKPVDPEVLAEKMKKLLA
ncbi:MAG: response regulator [Planctomycetota bacterium]|jgi:CheY-like chemotaxis protein